MKEIQKPSISPTAKLDRAKENVLYRDRIRRVFEYMLPLKSMQRKLQKLKERRQKRIGGREMAVFVYARA